MNSLNAKEAIYALGMDVLSHRSLKKLSDDIVDFDAKFEENSLDQETLSWRDYWQALSLFYQGQAGKWHEPALKAGAAENVAAKVLLIDGHLLRPAPHYPPQALMKDIAWLIDHPDFALIAPRLKNLKLIGGLPYWEKTLPDVFIRQMVEVFSHEALHDVSAIPLAGYWFSPLRVPLASLRAYRAALHQAIKASDVIVSSRAQGSLRIIHLGDGLMISICPQPKKVEIKLLISGIEMPIHSWDSDGEEIRWEMMTLDDWINASPRKVNPFLFHFLQVFINKAREEHRAN